MIGTGNPYSEVAIALMEPYAWLGDGSSEDFFICNGAGFSLCLMGSFEKKHPLSYPYACFFYTRVRTRKCVTA